MKNQCRNWQGSDEKLLMSQWRSAEKLNEDNEELKQRWKRMTREQKSWWSDLVLSLAWWCSAEGCVCCRWRITPPFSTCSLSLQLSCGQTCVRDCVPTKKRWCFYLHLQQITDTNVKCTLIDPQWWKTDLVLIKNWWRTDGGLANNQWKGWRPHIKPVKN